MKKPTNAQPIAHVDRVLGYLPPVLTVVGNCERPARCEVVPLVTKPRAVMHTAWVTCRDGVRRSFDFSALEATAFDEAQIMARAKFGREIQLSVRKIK